MFYLNNNSESGSETGTYLCNCQTTFRHYFYRKTK